MENRGLNRVFIASLLATLIAAPLTGCSSGGASKTTKAATESGTSTTSNSSGGTSGSSGSFSTSNLPPPQQFTVEAVGYTCTKITVRTNQVLKARFTPGINSTNVEGTGFSPQYSKLAVYIKVENTSFPTPLLRNGLSGDVQSSPIYDLSPNFTHVCGTNTSCRQDVEVEICQPNNDYRCYNFQEYCPHLHAYQTHPWNGELEIATDDTREIE